MCYRHLLVLRLLLASFLISAQSNPPLVLLAEGKRIVDQPNDSISLAILLEKKSHKKCISILLSVEQALSIRQFVRSIL
jgi:hypothetical protein